MFIMTGRHPNGTYGFVHQKLSRLVVALCDHLMSTRTISSPGHPPAIYYDRFPSNVRTSLTAQKDCQSFEFLRTTPSPLRDSRGYGIVICRIRICSCIDIHIRGDITAEEVSATH